MVPDLRKQELLKQITQSDVAYIKDLSEELGISLSTIRRDLRALEEDGEIVVMRGGAVRIKNGDYDEPVARKRLINSEAKEIIAKKAAALVEDGDCIYVDSGTTTVAMLKYLPGRNITIVSSSTQLMENMPIKGATCILLGGEVRDDLESVYGTLTEKMIMSMHFDKAFIGANGYIEDGAIYTYDFREARKKEIVKDYSKTTYVLMDTSKKNKYAFSKVFELSEGILITEED
ncbi:DeoR/GlpR transcriptional regulator [Clostridiales bacterium F-3ap]|uniref:DeoR/GlpR transcriptional regulator n=2 Tax=Anaerotalea alkaliphila TaxID=2662126 RepID=A0A7X5KLX3_9FIRM|nr:DeoR/GlpR family DNA-binding transcription regulator [Anaerotalea alkaliphila]NDL67321.1 DeoR/GlpR transcriptional regulator [Anaerotalea alkaliphila]